MSFYIVLSMENKSLAACDERVALIENLGASFIASADAADGAAACIVDKIACFFCRCFINVFKICTVSLVGFFVCWFYFFLCKSNMFFSRVVVVIRCLCSSCCGLQSRFVTH